MTKIYVLEGPLRGKMFEVTELASIGRGEACAVRLEGHHISRIHARLEKSGDAMIIKDNASRNGIFVNGRSVKESPLRPNDQIEIGEHLLVFEPSGDPEKLPRFGAAVLESLTDPFVPGEPDERIQKLVGVAASLVAMETEKEIAQHLLEALMMAISAHRGFVMLQDAKGELKPVARKVPAGDEEFALSNIIQFQLAKQRRAVIATDVRRQQPNEGKRVGILASPLATKAGLLGLVYLDVALGEAEARASFRMMDLRFAAALATFAATRISQLRRIAPVGLIGERPLPDLRAAFEKECVVEALRQKKGDLDAAAKLLGLTRATLDEKLKVMGLVATPAPAPSPAATAPPAIAPTKSPSAADWKSVQI